MTTVLSREEIARYSRHLVLDEVGMEGQARLKRSSVLCVGAGGLGSPAALYLVAAGVGRVGIVDDDVVESSNLQRQILHGSAGVGTPKVVSAKERLTDLNPLVDVRIHRTRIAAHNALELVSGYDVVIGGSDNLSTRYVVNDACVLAGKPYVYGAIFKFGGQASVFNHRGGPDYRDLYPNPPPPESTPSCAEAGVLGVLPGIVGTIQATEALKILLGVGTTLSGRLLIYDALEMRFRELELQRDPTRVPVTDLRDLDVVCGDRSAAENEIAFGRLSASEAKRRLDDGWSPYVLDVRSEAEAAIVRLSFADARCSHARVVEWVERLPGDRDLLVYCKHGGRSVRAIRTLVGVGFDPARLYNLEGGIVAWGREIDPGLPMY